MCLWIRHWLDCTNAMAKRKENKETGEEKKRKIKQSRNKVLKRVRMKRKQPKKKKVGMKLVIPEDGSLDYLKVGKEALVIDLKEQDSFNRRQSRQLVTEECRDEVTKSFQSTDDGRGGYYQRADPQTGSSGCKTHGEISLELSGPENLEKMSKHVDKEQCQTSSNEDSIPSSPQIDDIQLKRKLVKDVPTDLMRHSKRVLVADGTQNPANLCKEHSGGEGSQRITDFSDWTNDDKLNFRSHKIRKRERTSKKNNKNDRIDFLSSSSLSHASSPSSQLGENFSRIDLPDVSIVDVDDDFMYDNEEGTKEMCDSMIQEGSYADSEDDEQMESILEMYQKIAPDGESEFEQEESDSDSDPTECNSSLDRGNSKLFERTAENVDSPLSSNKKLIKTDEDFQGQRSDWDDVNQVTSDVKSPSLKVRGSRSKVNTSLQEAGLNASSQHNGKRTPKKRPKSKKVKKDKTPFRLFRHVESGKAILIFPEDAEAPFVGRVSLQTLVGSVTVNSFKVKANQCWYPVHATTTTSIPTLKVKVLEDHGQRKHEAEVSVIKMLKLGKDKDALTSIAANGPFAALLLQRLDCNAWNYAKQLNLSEYGGNVIVEYKIPMNMQYKQIFNELGFFLYPSKYCGVSQLKSIKSLSGQENAIDKILDSYKESDEVPVIVICGHQGSGKSTLTRNIVNSFLNETDGICYIEADTGQSELTPSCLLSLHYLTEPLLGIPFVHQRLPAKMFFFGSNETKKAPDLYLEMLAALHQYYTKTFPSKPLVVNTNGWVTGLGAFLLTDILHIMMPTQIVLLKDHDQVASLDFFSKRSWLRSEDERNHLSSPILTVQAAPKNPLGSKLLRRNLTLVGYLSTLYKPSLTGQKFKLSSVTPYVVPWSSVAVHVCNHTISPNHILYALNASVVGLCAVDPSKMFEIEGSVPSDGLPKILKETPVCDCLGLGIVRGIDPVTKVFYIITPVPEDELPRVTALIKGTHSLPHSMLKEDFDMDSLPYVATSLNPVSVSQPCVTTKRFSRSPAAIMRNLRNMATKAT